MNLSYNKIIKVKLALSGLKSEELANEIGVNKASLSRNESKIFADKVSQYFDKVDPDINLAVEFMLSGFSTLNSQEGIQNVKLNFSGDFKNSGKNINILSEPESKYKSEIEILREKISLLEKLIKDKEQIIEDRNRTIYLYQKNILKPEQ